MNLLPLNVINTLKMDNQDKRIISANEPATAIIVQAAYNVTKHTGIPIKLAIAKDFMSAAITGCVYAGFPHKSEDLAKEALKDAQDAQALIDAYNNQ